MNEPLFIISLIGGLSVLLSYLYLYYDDDADKAWGGIEEGRWRMAWIASALLTVVSYVFLWVCFVFVIEEQSLLLLSAWTVFLWSASQWAYLCLLDIKEQRRSMSLLINLTLTTIACVAVFVVTIMLEEHDGIKPYLIASSTYMLLHHGIVDNWLWYGTLSSVMDFVPV